MDEAAAAAAALVKHGGKRKAPSAESHADRAAASKKRATDAGHVLKDNDWACPSCGNLNWAKRAVCNSKTCDERRPGAGGSTRKKGGGGRAHKKAKQAWTDPAVARAWAPQADAATVARNQDLRAQYQADPGAMSEADRARAKMLIERDARKKAKKAARAEKILQAKSAKARRVEYEAANASR